MGRASCIGLRPAGRLALRTVRGALDFPTRPPVADAFWGLPSGVVLLGARDGRFRRSGNDAPSGVADTEGAAPARVQLTQFDELVSATTAASSRMPVRSRGARNRAPPARSGSRSSTSHGAGAAWPGLSQRCAPRRRGRSGTARDAVCRAGHLEARGRHPAPAPALRGRTRTRHGPSHDVRGEQSAERATQRCRGPHVGRAGYTGISHKREAGLWRPRMGVDERRSHCQCERNPGKGAPAATNPTRKVVGFDELVRSQDSDRKAVAGFVFREQSVAARVNCE